MRCQWSYGIEALSCERQRVSTSAENVLSLETLAPYFSEDMMVSLLLFVGLLTTKWASSRYHSPYL